MILATCSHAQEGHRGLVRVTSSRRDHSFFTGSGFPLTNSPAASCHCSISWSTSSTADICGDHLHRWQMLLSLRTHSLPVAETLKPLTLYTPECVERLYEKVSSADKAPPHEANHGSIYQRFAARTQPLVVFAHPP